MTLTAVTHAPFPMAFSPITDLLGLALVGESLSRAQLITLTELDEHSGEAALLRAVGDAVTRQRFGNHAMLLGQVGMETHPCEAECGFCAFGQGHNLIAPCAVADNIFQALLREAADSPQLYAFFLMYMHSYDFSTVLRHVETARANLPAHKQVVVNMGDFDRTQAEELRSAGASGAYHVLRLREGVDTRLNPAARMRTIEAIVAAGLDWYTCCEPIGPEHSPEELVDQMLAGADLHCFQHAVMRRVAVPGTPLAARGQITSLRFAQLAAVVTLAMRGNPRLASIAVHEPDMVGLTSGGNCVYAEFGLNPRDTTAETAAGRGCSLADCTTMLKEAGFTDFVH